MSDTQLQHHRIIVEPDNRLVRTLFADSTEAPAAPHDTDDYRGHAERAGCGQDVWRYCLEHDLCHVILGELIRGPSPTLWRVAHGFDTTLAVVEKEEEAAKTLHAFLNAVAWPEPYQQIRVDAGFN